MAAPPPYSEQPGGYPANPPVNPGYVDASKGAEAGYPAQPQPGYPQAGYPAQPQPGYPPAQYPPEQMQPAMAPQSQQGQQTIVIQQAPVVVTGNCPVCRAGMITEDFTCCGICLAICCFPLGLICCFLMRERHCTSCNARV